MSSVLPTPSLPICPDPEAHREPTPPERWSSLHLESFKILATLYNAEETSFYTRNNILVILQVGMVAAVAGLFSKILDNQSPAYAVRQLRPVIGGLCAAGLIAAVAWLFTVRRSKFIAHSLTEQL